MIKRYKNFYITKKSIIGEYTIIKKIGKRSIKVIRRGSIRLPTKYIQEIDKNEFIRLRDNIYG